MKHTIESIIADWKDKPGQLLMLLHDIQNAFGYVSDDAAKDVAHSLSIPLARIYEVLTFYHAFRREPPKDAVISVCTGTGCYLKGAKRLLQLFSTHISSRGSGLVNQVDVVETSCLGACGKGPLVKVELTNHEAVIYTQVDDKLATVIVNDHLIPALKQASDATPFVLPESLRNRQLSGAMAICSCSSPIVLEHLSQSPEGVGCLDSHYTTLKKIVDTLSPQEVIDQIKQSGLRGRGGAGFLTASKFQHAYDQESDVKFVICNADEGDPGGFISRYLLEGDPHTLIEGLAIAAYATGAHSGYIYIRAGYNRAVDQLEHALQHARSAGILGSTTFSANFSFDCEIRKGGGAFICGEETALIASIEGKRGIARPRPPYPTESGLWDKPTCVNNSETLACLPGIFRMGAETYSEIGTPDSTGTKLVALTGDVTNCGLTEVPLGMPLMDIVNSMGGGTASGEPPKAIHSGGPSGGIIPAEALDTPLCYKEFSNHNFMMGDGALSVLKQTDDMVELATYFMEFSVRESCGRCAPCRVGGKQVLDLLNTVLSGNGTSKDISSIKRICLNMEKASLCGLGQSAPNPVLSTLRYFEQEYLEKLTNDEDHS